MNPRDDPILKLPTAAEMEAFTKPVTMAPASDDWISAREARLMVAQMASVDLDAAAAALCRRALKWLRVRAHTWSRRVIRPEWMDLASFQREYGTTDLTHFSDAPSRMAWGEGLALFDTIYSHVPLLAPQPGVTLACWATGDFNVRVEMDFVDVAFEIVGLEFDRKGVLESMGVNEAEAGQRKPARVGGPGRAPKWDWEGAITSVVARANTPDGLPTGHGAQAEVERMIADYFGENCPSESEVRLRASRIMEAVERAGR